LNSGSEFLTLIWTQCINLRNVKPTHSGQQIEANQHFDTESISVLMDAKICDKANLYELKLLILIKYKEAGGCTFEIRSY